MQVELVRKAVESARRFQELAERILEAPAVGWQGNMALEESRIEAASRDLSLSLVQMRKPAWSVIT